MTDCKTATADALLPCPFCGNAPWGLFGPHTDAGTYWVECHGDGDPDKTCGDWHYTPDASDWQQARAETRAAWNERAASAAARQPLTEWIPVSERLPDSGVVVLACYRNGLGNLRRIRANWLAAKTAESSSDSEIGEYDEETDCFYDPEGWYERIDNWCDYTAVAVCEGDVTHWMPLPPPPVIGGAASQGSQGTEGEHPPHRLCACGACSDYFSRNPRT